MDVFFTSKNSGPSWISDPVHLLYFGADFEKALEAVNRNFWRYEKPFDRGQEYAHIYSVLPSTTDWEMVRFFAADGQWYSIVKVVIEPLPVRKYHSHIVKRGEGYSTSTRSGPHHVHSLMPGSEWEITHQDLTNPIRRHTHEIHWDHTGVNGITSPPIYFD